MDREGAYKVSNRGSGVGKRFCDVSEAFMGDGEVALPVGIRWVKLREEFKDGEALAGSDLLRLGRRFGPVGYRQS